MKNIILILIILFISIMSSFGASTKLFNIKQKIETIILDAKIGVDMYITSKNGCKFHIVGNYNTWTNTFTGYVTASGPGDCPHGTWYFGMIVSDNGNVSFQGDNPFIDILNSDDQFLNEFISSLEMM